MALPIILGAAKLATKVGGSLFANKKDPQRIQAAQDALARALAGDASALAYMQAQAVGSATQVGKDAFRSALEAYAANRTSFTPPPGATPLQQTVSSTVSAIGKDLATGVQQIGAGATNAASTKLGGTGITVPFSQQTLLILAAVAVAIIVFRK
jgi:hypothetical protein